MIYNESGRGRKLCPKCGKYVGIKSAVCENCKAPFGSGPTEPKVKEIKIFDGPGTGRKQCPACSVYVGVRYLACPKCSAEFPQKEVTPPKEEPKKEEPKKVVAVVKPVVESVYQEGERRIGIHGTILTPKGDCPVPLTATDRETVFAWRDQLQKLYFNRGEELSIQAVCYFVRHFYDIRKPEYKEVITLLQERPVPADNASLCSAGTPATESCIS